MKRLTEDQLESIINNITVKSFKENQETIVKNITASIEEGANCYTALSAAMTAYGIEIIKQFNSILVKSLYEIFYDGGEQGE